jgi:Protein of unknown function (DUF3027)
MATVDNFGAAELARSAALTDAKDEKFVGQLTAIDYDDEDRLATYQFESFIPGYLGWRWAVTIAKVDGDAVPTICDVVLLPSEDALLAPKWVPYRDRIQASDVTPGVIVPTPADDERLIPGFNELNEELDPAPAFEFGLGRARVLSITGRDLASKRWYEGDRGPNNQMSLQAPKPCHSCGFYIPIAGSLRQAFGVCANLLSPEDARVVSFDHGCGAHSEALVTQ